MSIPKEPRQLMINLMYLVLTAMLALNVSAEIINAFFMLEKGIHHTNDIIDATNEKVIASMEEISKTKTQYQPLVDESKRASSAIEPLVKLIEEVREQVVKESGGRFPNDGSKDAGKPIGKKDKDTPQRILVDQKKGAQIKAAVIKAKAELIQFIRDVKAKNIKGVVITDAEIADLEKNFLLEIDDESWKKNQKPTWEAHVFGYLPVAACYPLFTKFENDAKASVSQVINFLAAKMGATEVTYDKFAVFSSPKSPYILLGETFETEIALGAFSSQAQFSVNVNGQNIPVKDGKAEFKSKPGSLGQQKYKATITVKNPLTGEVESVNKEFSYEVGSPSVTVSADAMNVFYIGVENPLSVSASGVSSNDVQVTLSGPGGGVLKPGSGKGKYMVTVTEPTAKGSFCSVVITNKKDNKSIGKFDYRVKRIPNPVAKMNQKTGGNIPAGELRSMSGIYAELENFDFDAKCTISGYNATVQEPRKDPYNSPRVSSGAFSPDIVKALATAKAGTVLTIYDVSARCPGDPAPRAINSLVFNAK